MTLFSALRAAGLHTAGIKKSKAGDDEAAIASYRQALALDPNQSETLYNLGLIFKYRGAWRESLDCNSRADALQPGDEATLWNLAIAATALREWQAARGAWRRLGITIPAGEGPIEDHRGSVPVRLNADHRTDAPVEVVWSDALCPVRSRIINIPTSDTRYRYGDVVLHDGAAVGYRMNAGKEVPVFNVLELFEPSRFSTFEASVEVDGPEDIEVLDQACDQVAVAFEDWTASIRNLCSEGRPHEGHDHELKQSDSWERMRRVGFAAQDEASITAVLKAWQDRRRRVADFRCTLDARLS